MEWSDLQGSPVTYDTNIHINSDLDKNTSYHNLLADYSDTSANRYFIIATGVDNYAKAQKDLKFNSKTYFKIKIRVKGSLI